MVILEHSVICLDIGNSTSHLGVYEMGQLIDERRIPSFKLINSPNEILDQYNFSKFPLSYCSVFPEAEKSLINYINKKNITVFNLNYKTIVDLPITYPNPTQIGQDRLANSFAVFHSTDLPSLVIDVGTATTFDVVTETGGYEGGIIVPGPQGFLDFLNQNTALLPKVNIQEHLPHAVIGKETRQAMLIGAKLGHTAMKEGLISHLSKEIELQFLKKPKLILTGGASTQTNISNIEHRPDLTIFGLALAFQFKETNRK